MVCFWSNKNPLLHRLLSLGIMSSVQVKEHRKIVHFPEHIIEASLFLSHYSYNNCLNLVIIKLLLCDCVRHTNQQSGFIAATRICFCWEGLTLTQTELDFPGPQKVVWTSQCSFFLTSAEKVTVLRDSPQASRCSVEWLWTYLSHSSKTTYPLSHKSATGSNNSSLLYYISCSPPVCWYDGPLLN